MKKKYFINAGDRFGRLTVIELCKDKRNYSVCLCRCECGNEKICYPQNLVKGVTQSCGCLRKEIVRKTNSKKNEYRFENGYVVGITTKGEEFFFDEEDFEEVSGHCWLILKNGYVSCGLDGKTVTLHRFLMSPPQGMVIDHINHNKADNRRSNLRICTVSENALNRAVPPKGIRIKCNGKKTYYGVYLRGKYYGTFKDYDSAKAKRDEVWGEIQNVK